MLFIGGAAAGQVREVPKGARVVSASNYDISKLSYGEDIRLGAEPPCVSQYYLQHLTDSMGVDMPVMVVSGMKDALQELMAHYALLAHKDPTNGS